MSGALRRLAPGQRPSPHLTVLGALDVGGRDPVYIVWHHDAWCAMCLKLFQRPAQARWEARALAGLAHPGIVRLLEDGSPRYILTEFLEGPSLKRLLRSRRPSRLAIADALRVAIHLGAALAHLHGRGLVHLDLKPRNVIVTRRRPVLVDLGSARRLDGRPLGRPQGTDVYMAPEQARGEAPAPACDVWGLGMTLFESLTGRRPFPDGDQARPFPQLALAPIPLRALRPKAPQALADLLAACLAPAPQHRPPLATLLPALNQLIPAGPKMWPDGLAPGADNPTSASLA
jgi:serine/threonine protein kinase